jgi:hypothetical protein
MKELAAEWRTFNYKEFEEELNRCGLLPCSAC